MTSKDHNKSLGGWEQSARYWEKYRELIAQMFTPLTSALIEEAHIGASQHVLDIGGGSGEPSLTIASVVGPDGSVMFTDPVPGMIETTRTEAERRGLKNLRFTQCSGDNLPFPDNTFGAAVGRLSAMFFADSDVGVREALRVTIDDGYVSFVVWGPKEANPFFTAVNAVMDRFVEDLPNDDGPDPFHFAEPGKLAGILRNAGAKSVIERKLNFQITSAISFEQFWQLRAEMSETMREKLTRVTPEQLLEIKQAAADAAKMYFTSGTMNFPAEALIVTGQA